MRKPRQRAPGTLYSNRPPATTPCVAGYWFHLERSHSREKLALSLPKTGNPCGDNGATALCCLRSFLRLFSERCAESASHRLAFSASELSIGELHRLSQPQSNPCHAPPSRWLTLDEIEVKTTNLELELEPPAKGSDDSFFHV